MNNALEYMLKNQKKVLNQANKITRNLQVAQDVFQDVAMYFHEKPEAVIEKPASYVWLALRSHYLSTYYGWEKKMLFDKHNSGENGNMSYFDTLTTPEKYQTVDHKIDLEKLLAFYDEKCYPNEKRAIELFLEHDTMTIAGENRSSLKTNRDRGLEKLNIFFSQGKFTNRLGQRSKLAKGKAMQRTSYAKTTNNF